MSTVAEPLKYLFVAEFEDGTALHQSDLDTSALDPQRSAFYDVLQNEDKLVRFTLIGDGNKFSLDLRTLAFSINGVQVFLNDPEQMLYEVKLVFSRTNRLWMKDGNVGGEALWANLGFKARRLTGEEIERVIQIP